MQQNSKLAWRIISLLFVTACATQPEGWSSLECSDGADNDDNGLVDCDDPGCDGNRDCRDLDTEADSDTEVDSDTQAEVDTEADTEPDTEADTEPLDPIPQALAENPPAYDSDCDQRNGVNVAGGLGWHLGRLTFTGPEIRGYAVLGLRANPTWQAGPGSDCQLTWAVSGIQGTAANCSACAYSLPLTLTLLAGESTCDPGLIASLPAQQTVTYNVELDGEDAELYFPATGNRFAVGTATSTRLAYRGEPSCQFFSSR